MFTVSQKAVIGATLACLATLSAASLASADSYDKGRAVNYARSHANAYNYPVYPAFTQDCANFVSQCLSNGGWTPKYDRNPAYDWWYGGYSNGFWSYSQAWSVAHLLFNFTLNTNRGTVIGQGVKSNRGAYNSLEPGDLIFCDWYKTVNGKQAQGEDGWIDHVYIVTGKDSRGILVSAHTTNRLDLPFQSVFDDPKVNQGLGDSGRFYYVRMRTQY